MKSRTTARFWKAFTDLPVDIQKRARQAFRLFQRNNQTSLRFKKIHASKPVCSIRIGHIHRALGTWEGDEVIWFWIGSHADYDRLVSKL